MRSTPSLFWALLACASSLTPPPCAQAAEFRDVLSAVLDARDADSPADRNLNLPPPRSPPLVRKVKTWGDGFVRMPVQRHVFGNGTRRYRTGRMRKPKRGTYPASNNATRQPPTSTVVARPRAARIDRFRARRRARRRARCRV